MLDHLAVGHRIGKRNTQLDQVGTDSTNACISVTTAVAADRQR
jgi:hypothetical protein